MHRQDTFAYAVDLLLQSESNCSIQFRTTETMRRNDITIVEWNDTLAQNWTGYSCQPIQPILLFFVIWSICKLGGRQSGSWFTRRKTRNVRCSTYTHTRVSLSGKCDRLNAVMPVGVARSCTTCLNAACAHFKRRMRNYTIKVVSFVACVEIELIY